MKLLKLLALINCFCLPSRLPAQTSMNKTDLIARTLKSLYQNQYEQRILLQTDRQIYLAGEKMWFKAYVLNYFTQKIDVTSKNLFTDLVDDSDNVISRLVLDNQELRTEGSINLADSLKTGFYWLRSYTAKMLQHQENICIQPIFVLNKNLHDEKSFVNKFKNAQTSKSKLPVVKFFPERLTNIPGIISTLVLKITDANNNPLIINGNVVDSRDSIVTTFSTNRFGLSRISFVDDASLKYTAVLNTNEKSTRYEIPAVDSHTAQLSIANQTSQSVKAFVTLEEALPENFQTIILGIHGDSLCYAAAGNGTYGTMISLENFPGGISSLLLFDNNQHLLDERNIYINKENYNIAIQTNKPNYSARENVQLNIDVTNTHAKPLVSSLNVSVQDAWLSQLSDNIETNNFPPADKFLLNNWIELNKNDLLLADIDLFMVATKSFNKNIVQSKSDSINKYDDNSTILNLTGRITGRKNVAIKGRVVTVMSKNVTNFFLDVDTTGTDGTFKIPLPQNTDSLTLVFQVMNKNFVTTPYENIRIDSFTFPVFTTPVSVKKEFLNYNLSLISLLQKYHIDTAITFQGKGWLKPVIVKTVEKKQLNYDESKRINSISQILTSDKFRYGGYHAVANALLAVPGVSLLQGDLTIFGYTPAADMKGFLKPLLVVDGVIMGDAGLGYFNDLQPADIDFIEVLRGGEAAYYGMRGAGGVISVNTRHGVPADILNKNNFLVFKPLIYHVCPRFYMPDYSIPEIKNNSTPDPRTTVYWNGNVATNSHGQAAVNFYTADNPTNYTVTITGFTEKGDVVYKRILVSKN